MHFTRLASLTTLTLFGLTACSGYLTDPDPLRLHFSTSNTVTGQPLAHGLWVPASTNEANEQSTLPHVLFEDVGVGQVTLKFVNTTNSLTFFEYRIDGVTVGSNIHPVITGDVVHPGVCVDNRASGAVCGGQQSSKTQIFNAASTVDIRLALGGERDWDFDWTRFYVLSLENKDQCKGGEWEALGFRNQGQCVRYVETGKDSRIGQ